MTSSPTQLALITGGSGFLATQIILLLVDRGVRVRSCVRSPEKAIAWMEKQIEDRPEIESMVDFVYVANMELPGAYDTAVQGVDMVFHVASPFNFTFRDNEKDMLIPARNGALNLLRAAQGEPRIKRVIFTSSWAKHVFL
ncbi:hypothetical protein P7C70_g7445, partial [Phenoliferia sp. Uapishka_3]